MDEKSRKEQGDETMQAPHHYLRLSWLRVCVSWILLFPVCMTVARHMYVFPPRCLSPKVLTVSVLSSGFPSNVAAAASPVGSNVSCRKGIERIDMTVGRNSACTADLVPDLISHLRLSMKTRYGPTSRAVAVSESPCSGRTVRA